MKFLARLQSWGNRGSRGNVLKVFLRLRASANRRVGLHLPLIASDRPEVVSFLAADSSDTRALS
jgi:hypothetical protein